MRTLSRTISRRGGPAVLQAWNLPQGEVLGAVGLISKQSHSPPGPPRTCRPTSTASCRAEADGGCGGCRGRGGLVQVWLPPRTHTANSSRRPWRRSSDATARPNQLHGQVVGCNYSSAGEFVDVQYGSPALFDMGLEGYVGLSDVHVIRAMMREHASTEKFSASNNKGARP